MEIPKNDTAQREQQECSSSPEQEVPGEQTSDRTVLAEEPAPEEAGYGYGV
jgi:hypothetical protein